MSLFLTERTDVRLLTAADAPALHAYYVENDPHLSPWDMRPPGYHDLEAWHARAAAFVEEQTVGLALRMLAFDRAGGGLAGVCFFTNIVRGAFQACHVGYSVAARFAGRGLMTEILTGAVDHMFEVEGLHRIMANYLPDNARSARVLEKTGFEREGFARAYLYLGGAWRDHVLTSKVNSPR